MNDYLLEYGKVANTRCLKEEDMRLADLKLHLLIDKIKNLCYNKYIKFIDNCIRKYIRH
jgi:hypothetical protein